MALECALYGANTKMKREKQLQSLKYVNYECVLGKKNRGENAPKHEQW